MDSMQSVNEFVFTCDMMAASSMASSRVSGKRLSAMRSAVW